MTEFQTVLEELANIRALIEKPPVKKVTIDTHDIAAMLGKANSTIYPLVRLPSFPLPIYCPGVLARCWLLEDFMKWLKSQKMLKGVKL
ncbi:MAG: hypothetical protein JKY60_20395 [Kordiimonadaceae bacterium]|nr:hypothetical protein [Kordiimonadaceae bacterium]